MNLQQKEQVVNVLAERFSQSELAILINFERCTCEELTNLRREFDKSQSKFAIVKNTRARRVIKDTPLESMSEFFKGQTAVVWSNDPVAPAKVIVDFLKTKENVDIKVGALNGRVLTVAEVKELAALPSHEELLAKLLGLLSAPATRLLQTINAPATQVARVLGAWRDKLEGK